MGFTSIELLGGGQVASLLDTFAFDSAEDTEATIYGIKLFKEMLKG